MKPVLAALAMAGALFAQTASAQDVSTFSVDIVSNGIPLKCQPDPVMHNGSLVRLCIKPNPAATASGAASTVGQTGAFAGSTGLAIGGGLLGVIAIAASSSST